eukprot:1699959-Pyramimonas_sp.AAC.1
MKPGRNCSHRFRLQQPSSRSEDQFAPEFIRYYVGTAYEIFVMDDLGGGPDAGQDVDVCRHGRGRAQPSW